MSQLPAFNGHDPATQWDRFCALLWHDEALGFWLDVSRMALDQPGLDALRPRFAQAFEAMAALEAGAIANPDEQRMVGHYWLRAPQLAPDAESGAHIASEVDQIETFGRRILAGELMAPCGRPFTDVLWIGIGGSGLGPLLIIRALQEQEAGLPFHFFDNVDPQGMSRTLRALEERLTTTLDRRIEITGPTDRKMVVNALNSGANVYMPDFEDSNCPTWDNLIAGQVNLRDAVRGTISLTAGGKTYRLGTKRAVMLVRPRGWHLWEKHVLVDGSPVPGGIFDFALFFFHNARALVARGSGPYFYLPKMQSHLECRLWNDVFLAAQQAVGLPSGTIKATCLIETLPAAFEMDEFLYELRQHSAGLNCGRWDYLFSAMKTLRADPSRIFPDRGFLTMDMPFMRAYTTLVIKTCHRRGVHAIGGMSAFIPIKNDPAANKAVMDKVKADKLREVTDGHDGTWVAHPGLIPVAKAVFDEHMKTPNQLHRLREDVAADGAALLAVPDGPRTVGALRSNVNVSVQYLEAWLGGNGCVPLHNLMEDAATAEISRTQVWQWVRHGAVLDDGQRLTRDRAARVILEEMDALRGEVGSARFATGHFMEAAALFKQMVTARELPDFLTLPAYEALLVEEFAAEREGGGGGAAARARL